MCSTEPTKSMRRPTKQPEDWEEVHPDFPFEPYQVTSADVEELIAVRKWVFENADSRSECLALYRAGKYTKLLEQM